MVERKAAIVVIPGRRLAQMKLYLDNCSYNRPYDVLVKAEGFDYTKWQREYFDKKTKEEIDLEMDAYFATHPYSGDSKKVI